VCTVQSSTLFQNRQQQLCFEIKLIYFWGGSAPQHPPSKKIDLPQMDPEEIQHIETTLLRHMNTSFIYNVELEPITIIEYLKLLLGRPDPKLIDLIFGIRAMYHDNLNLIEELMSLHLTDDYYFSSKSLKYKPQSVGVSTEECVFKCVQDYFKTKTDYFVLK
jgi:hypothetical protein